jgi:hypothetical protein
MSRACLSGVLLDQGDRLGQQPAGRERQALYRRPVEPLRVIDQAGQRLVLCRGGQQARRRPAANAAGRLQTAS